LGLDLQKTDFFGISIGNMRSLRKTVTKAAQLETSPGDFTEKSFSNQPDGSLFYKTLEGRDDMPSYKKKIPDEEDIWCVVNYMRTLAK